MGEIAYWSLWRPDCLKVEGRNGEAHDDIHLAGLSHITRQPNGRVLKVFALKVFVVTEGT